MTSKTTTMTRRKKIFVVDDEPDIVYLVKQILEHAGGYEVAYATSGEEAIRRIPEAKPDLILLDLMMPDRSGFEVARELAEFTAETGTPIIVLTALHAFAYSQESLVGHANVVLAMFKPFEPSTLLENLRRALTPVPV